MTQNVRTTGSLWLGRGMALAAVALLCLALRLYHLGWESAWLDEYFSLGVARMQWHKMMLALTGDYSQPPLYYIVLHLWLKLAGFSIESARMLSVLIGTFVVVLTFSFTKSLFGFRVAIMAALMLAVSQLGVVYSQEARCYALLQLLTLSSAYLFVSAGRSKHLLTWCGFVVSSTLLIYTHYYGVFVLIALVLFAAIYRREYSIPLVWWTWGFAFMFISYLPWILSGGAGQLSYAVSTVRMQSTDPMAVHWYSFLTSLNWFHNGKWNGLNAGSPLWTFPAGFALFFVPALFAFRPSLNSQNGFGAGNSVRYRTLIVLLWLVPLCGVLGLGYIFGIQYQPRYAISSVAPYYMLVAYGIDGFRAVWLRGIAVAALVAYSHLALRGVYFVHNKHDYRGASSYAAGLYRQGDCICFLPAYERASPTPSYWQIEQPTLTGVRTVTLEEAAEGRVQCNRLLIVSDSLWAKDAMMPTDARIMQMLQNRFSSSARKQFTGIEVSAFTRKSNGSGWGTP